MMYKIFFLSLFSLICCNAQKKPVQPNHSENKNIVYLREGENRFVNEVQMNATFNRVVGDSRCPAGSNCIWQGVGTVEINLMSTHSRPVTFNLSTATVPGKNYSNSFQFNGYTVSLVSLTPQPGSKDGGKQKYTAGIKFDKGAVPNRKDRMPTPIESQTSRASEDTR